MAYFLGVDGGNTKTIALVSDGEGRILGAGRAGCSDVYAHPTVAAAVDEIALAVNAALDAAGLSRDVIAAGCFSLAGADWQEDYDDLHRALTARGFGATISVYNDAIGALRAGSPDGTGVVVNCGTGAAMGARRADGAFWHTSFWQDSLGGRELGQQAIRAVRHAAIGMEAPTALTALVLAHFDQPTPTDLLRRFWLRPLNPPSDLEVSKLAPVVLGAAEGGDAVARRIVEAHGVRLAEYALAAARQVEIEDTPFHLVLAGGIFRHTGDVLKDAVVKRVLERQPGARPILSRYEPAVGALMLALESGGVEITPDVTARFDQTMPPADLFRT